MCDAGMDLTPQQVKEEKEEGAADGGGADAAAEQDALLNLRVAALVDTTSTTVFSYICQARLLCLFDTASVHTWPTVLT